MKTGFKFGIAAVALTACIAGSTMWANADSEDEAIKGSVYRLTEYLSTDSDILNQTTERPTN